MCTFNLEEAQATQLSKVAQDNNVSLENIKYDKEKRKFSTGKDMLKTTAVNLELPIESVKFNGDVIGEGLYSKTETGIWNQIPVAIRWLKYTEKLNQNQLEMLKDEVETLRTFEGLKIVNGMYCICIVYVL